LTVPAAVVGSAPRALFAMTSLRRNQGGIATFNRNLVRALQPAGSRAGADVRALAYHDPPEPPLDPGYLTEPGLYSARGSGSSRADFVLRYAASLAGFRPRVVLCGHLHLAVVSWLFSRVWPHPYVVFCHLVECTEELSALRLRTLRDASLCVGVSEFTSAILRERLGVRRVATCYNGLDDLSLPGPGALPRVADAHGVERSIGDSAILIVSRLDPGERYKGHTELIGSLARLIGRMPAAQLVVVGEGGDRARLEDLARREGVGEAVLFTGFVEPPALSAAFERCRVFAMPSRGEGFGLVYLEAMRFAKPCIASPLDAGSEVVADGESGFVVDPREPDRLDAALAALLTDAALAARMGRAGERRLRERFAFTNFRDRIWEVLQPWLGPAAGVS
jgi:phosphatidylinositol alpha-1,6-mannosyltransferase